MPKSKHGPKHKAKVKANNIKKAKIKQMSNQQEKTQATLPVSYTYHKDATSVAIPMKAWQLLNSLAKELQPLAMLVSTFEQLGQEHIADGTLIPVFQADIEQEKDEQGNPKFQNGQPSFKLRDDFWEKDKKVQLVNPDGSPLGDIHKLQPEN